MSTIKLILPPGCDFTVKDLSLVNDSFPSPPLPAVALHPAGDAHHVHCVVAAPSGLKQACLRFVGLSWGEECVLDVSLDHPFGGGPGPADEAGEGPSSKMWGDRVMKGQELHEQQQRSEEFSKEQGQEVPDRRFSEAEVAGNLSEQQQGEDLALIRIKIPACSKMLEQHLPGLPIVLLLVGPGQETPEAKQFLLAQHQGLGTIDDHALLLVLPEKAADELDDLWEAMVQALQMDEEKQGFQHHHTQDPNAEKVLRGLARAFGKTEHGSKAHWLRAWKSSLVPLVHDLTGLLYSTHHLPQLQQQLARSMTASGLQPTRDPPLQYEAQLDKSASAASTQAAGEAPEGQGTEAAAPPAGASATDPAQEAAFAAALSCLLCPESRGSSVRESVASLWSMSRPASMNQVSRPSDATGSTSTSGTSSSSTSGRFSGAAAPVPAAGSERGDAVVGQQDATQEAPLNPDTGPPQESPQDPTQKMQESAVTKVLDHLCSQPGVDPGGQAPDADFNSTELVTKIFDLALDTVPILQKVRRFLANQPQEKPELLHLSAICSEAVEQALKWVNEQVTAHLPTGASSAPSPRPVQALHLASYPASPTAALILERLLHRDSAGARPDSSQSPELQAASLLNTHQQPGQPQGLLQAPTQAAPPASLPPSLQTEPSLFDWPCRQEVGGPSEDPAHEQSATQTVAGWAAQQQQEGFLGSPMMQLRATVRGFGRVAAGAWTGDQVAENAYLCSLPLRQELGRQVALSLQIPFRQLWPYIIISTTIPVLPLAWDQGWPALLVTMVCAAAALAMAAIVDVHNRHSFVVAARRGEVGSV